MAEAGPSSSAQRDTVSASALTSTTSSTVPKHSRIHFPQDRDHVKFGSTRSHSSAEMAALGLGRPPLSRRVTPGTEGNISGAHVRNGSDDVRPRVKSVDVHLGHAGNGAYGGFGVNVGPVPGPSRLRTRSEFVGDARKTTVAGRKASRKEKMRAELPEAAASYLTPATSFSDEYDLAHEDPRIIEDVQRAIKLKARREARIRALQSVTSKDTSSLSDAPSGSSVSVRSSPLRSTFGPISAPPPVAPPSNSLAVESEVDFSPSVGGGPGRLHPVPTSSNGGATLDWTGSISDDEKLDRRWSISIKRKNKDKAPVPTRSSIEEEISLYKEKLAKIHKKAKIHTIRKADITREQLGRRYAAMLPSNKTNSTLPINLLTVAKWYNGQDAVVQTALDKSEPLTWLKHLLDKEGRESTSRFPWNLTALIMEEYVRSKTRPETMETIPEDGVMEVINQTPPHVSSVGHGDNRSPSTSSWSYSVPGTSLEPSLSRRKPSHDGQVSFEPQVDSGRDSIGEDYRGSVDHSIRMRQDTYSPRSSINSSIFYGRVHGLSPNSSRLHFRDLASRLKRKPYPGSDDGLSSARNSISEQSQEEDPGYRSHSPRLKTPRRTNLMLSRSQPGSEDERKPFSAEPSESGDLGLSSGENGPMTARQPSYSIPSSPQPANSAVASPKPPSQTKRPIPRLARKRASLPSSPRHFFTREKEKQQRFADEAQERREYDRKNQLLEDLMLQNWRTRQILHKVGGNIKEYENVQKSLAASLGAEYTSIPQEVLDALNHDPCSVVSGTKRFKSWRAVEDIHGRIVRQRDTLRNFAQTTAGSGITTPTKSSFVDSIATLTDALQQLEVHRQHIVEKAETVAEALVRVKGVHATVKREYDETMGHTSLVYPELSQIITLEESYRNHYQQLWNIGLDALTLLLDTVTPFWRNYGKVIGQDIQDFLIIPWYRNEFTGEAKRYPIKSFPRRSFRHWIGLLICTVVAMLVTTLQIRAAWSCTLNYNLPWITHIGLRYMFIPLFNIGVLIQWTAVLVELAMVFAIFFVFVWWLGWAVRLLS